MEVSRERHGRKADETTIRRHLENTTAEISWDIMCLQEGIAEIYKNDQAQVSMQGNAKIYL